MKVYGTSPTRELHSSAGGMHAASTHNPAPTGRPRALPSPPISSSLQPTRPFLTELSLGAEVEALPTAAAPSEDGLQMALLPSGELPGPESVPLREGISAAGNLRAEAHGVGGAAR